MASSNLDELDGYKDHLNRRDLTFDDLCRKFEDDELIADIARDFETWEATAPYLGIKRSEIREIKSDNVNEAHRKVAILHKWMEKKGDEATYLNFCKALIAIEDVKMFDCVLDLLKDYKDDEGVDLESIKEEDMRFLCGCGQCSVQDFLSNGCPNPWENHTYPILNIKTLSTKRKLELLARLDEDMTEVKEQFGIMMSCEVQRAFREQLGDHPERVKDLTIFILAQFPLRFMEEEKQSQLKHELHDAETIGDVFVILVSSFVSWFNHLLVGSITKSFHIAEEEYKRYVCKTLAPFLQRSLFEIPKDSFSSESHEGSGQFVLKIEVPPPKERIKGTVLLPLKRHVARTLRVTIESLDICSYDKGCFELFIKGPSRLLDGIFPLNEQTLSALGSMTVGCQGLKIVSVKYGNVTQSLSGIEVGPVIDDSGCDFSSTPLSNVNHLFTCLLVEIQRLNKDRVSEFLNSVLTHKPISLRCGDYFPEHLFMVTDDLFDTVFHTVSSFFNYKLLELILKHLTFGNLDIEYKLREYIQELERLQLTDMPPLLHPTKNIKNFCSDLLQVEYQKDVKTVEDLIGIRDTLASIHQLEPYSLILYCIDTMERELGFLFVKNAQESILTADSLMLSRLRESKIARITFRNESINLISETLTDTDDDSGMSMGVTSEEETPPISLFIKQKEISSPSDLAANSSSNVTTEGYSSLSSEESGSLFSQEIISLSDLSRLTTDSSSNVTMTTDSSSLTPEESMAPYFNLPLMYPQAPESQGMPPEFSGLPFYPQPQISSTAPYLLSGSELSLEESIQAFFPTIANPVNQEQQSVALDREMPESCLEEEWPDVEDLKPQHHSMPPPLPHKEVPVAAVSSSLVTIEEINRNGVFHVCKTCLSLGYNVEDLIKYFCLKPFPHEGKPDTSVTWDRNRHCFVEVEPLTELSTKEVKPLTELSAKNKPLTKLNALSESFVPGAHEGRFGSLFGSTEPMADNKGGRSSFLFELGKPVIDSEDIIKKSASVLQNKLSEPLIAAKASKSHQNIHKEDFTSREKKIVNDNPIQLQVKNPVAPGSVQTRPTEYKSDSSHKAREEWKCYFQKRLDRAALVDEKYLAPDLSKANYRDKFYHLLCYEESEHISLLSEKCDGLYDFIIIGEEEKDRGEVVKLGCIRGMDGDQIQYASQASEAVFLVNPATGEDICTAELSSVNYYRSDEDFRIELSRMNAGRIREAKLQIVRRNWYRVDVEFEVKHSYFNTLHRAVISVPDSVIAKLLPHNKMASTSSLPNVPHLQPECWERNLSVDRHSQFQALEAIVKFHPSVPIIVAGPFGSGKTRILARSAVEFGTIGLKRNLTTRILICAHHANTVNAYKDFLTSVFEHEQKVKIIQIVRKRDFFQQKNSSLLNKTLSDFKRDIQHGAYMSTTCIIVLTTYMTSLNVSDILSSRGGVFTHVLLDEAAQVREPEAVSSLCAANASTKVIIAGDSKQVGPYVVVLGETARRHGLQRSLFERLEEHYEKAGPPLSQRILRLQINYRCHPKLTSLLANTMYDYPISCGATDSLTHPANPQSPCVFHCYTADNSSVRFDKMMELEADAVIDQVKKYFGRMPQSRGWRNCTAQNDVCIISSNRNQLNIIKKKLGWIKIQLLPSYVVQGHEFQAVFLSTLEHLDANGESSNPTKSLITPRIFNTVLSRSKSLVVAVGNPFFLLETEKKMGHSEKCWKKYLQLCLKTKSVTYGSKVSSEAVEKELCRSVGVTLATPTPSIQYTPTSDSEDVFINDPEYSWHVVSKAKERPQSYSYSREPRRDPNPIKQKPKSTSSPWKIDTPSSRFLFSAGGVAIEDQSRYKTDDDKSHFKRHHSYQPTSKPKNGQQQPHARPYKSSSSPADARYRPSETVMGDYFKSSSFFHQQSKRTPKKKKK